MNDIISSILLGFVQGVTEFLPISSSGHLIVLRDFLGIETTYSLLFDVLLHLATALAIIVYFRKEIISLLVQPAQHKVLWLAIIFGSIPAVVFGLYLDGALRSSFVVALALISGSVLFLFAEKISKQNSPLTIKRGIIIGFFQALALIPGTSRSGVTISGGLLLGMNRAEAAKFSFFLGLPVIMGAGFLQTMKSLDVLGNAHFGFDIFLGSIIAFLTGLVSIHFLLKFLKNNKLSIFAWYRIGLALLILLFM